MKKRNKYSIEPRLSISTFRYVNSTPVEVGGAEAGGDIKIQRNGLLSLRWLVMRLNIGTHLQVSMCLLAVFIFPRSG